AKFPPSPYNTVANDTSGYAFSDTIALQAGAQWQWARQWEASAGAAWYPTPVPAQTGRTNFVDSALLGFSLGERYDFRMFEKRFAISVAMQLFLMMKRTTYKDPSQIVDEFPDAARTLESKRPMPEAQGLQTNNPGFPGYEAGGYMATASVSLSHFF